MALIFKFQQTEKHKYNISANKKLKAVKLKIKLKAN